MSEILDDRAFKLPKLVNWYVLLSAGPYGVLLLIAPQIEAALLGLAPTPQTLMLLRMFATALLYAAVFSIAALKLRTRRFLMVVGAANAMQDGMLSVLFVLSLLQGTIQPIAWAYVPLFLSHVILNGWVALRMRQMAPRSSMAGNVSA